ncbi:uncharacterized protein LOC134218353 [Armigeres subalbatus]|uniref:uncharacterized protein LOC134218353 n=1 Tax=Armigeres subalbatus TaxID=124917 RepID=UPI002ED04EE7
MDGYGQYLTNYRHHHDIIMEVLNACSRYDREKLRAPGVSKFYSRYECKGVRYIHPKKTQAPGVFHFNQGTIARSSGHQGCPNSIRGTNARAFATSIPRRLRHQACSTSTKVRSRETPGTRGVRILFAVRMQGRSQHPSQEDSGTRRVPLQPRYGREKLRAPGVSEFYSRYECKGVRSIHPKKTQAPDVSHFNQPSSQRPTAVPVLWLGPV